MTPRVAPPKKPAKGTPALDLHDKLAEKIATEREAGKRLLKAHGTMKISDVTVAPWTPAPMTWWAHHWCANSWAVT